MSKADVIIPVLNEEQILEEFYRRVCALDLDLNLIFVDNASSDRSVEIIEGFPGVTLVRHASNEGYGGSLIDGMNHCHNENIIVIDADCEYPPEAIPDILQALERHDLVYTSRLLHRRSADEANMPYLKMLGNQIISGLYNVLFRQSTTDLYTGCKGFKRACVEGVQFRRKGFEHVLEFACVLSKRGHRIHDIPVAFTPRHTGNSKMRHLSETTKFLSLLLLFRVTLSGPGGAASYSND